MENVENKEGNWLNISYEILLNPELDCTEKILLAEIQSLHKLQRGCFASNEHFALLLGLKTASAASRRISRLTEMGYITTKNQYGNGNCVGRVITPTFKKAPEKSAIIETGHSEGSSKRNQVVPEEHGGSSDWNQVVPEQQRGGSDSTRGVVPLRQGGSSERNTINTVTNTELKEQDIRTNILEQATSTDTGKNQIENLFDIKESSLQQSPIPEVEALDDWNKFPVEFYDVLDKRDIQGWNSLSAREARIFWDYKYKFNSFIDSNPELSEHRIL